MEGGAVLEDSIEFLIINVSTFSTIYPYITYQSSFQDPVLHNQ